MTTTTIEVPAELTKSSSLFALAAAVEKPEKDYQDVASYTVSGKVAGKDGEAVDYSYADFKHKAGKTTYASLAALSKGIGGATFSECTMLP